MEIFFFIFCIPTRHILLPPSLPLPSLPCAIGGEEEEEGEGGETMNADCDAGADISDLAIDSEAPKTVTVESGNFTVSSTVGGDSGVVTASGGSAGAEVKSRDCFIPCGRFNSG